MDILNNFEKSLEYKGRILEIKGMHVWCNSVVKGEDKKYHAFFSGWSDKGPHNAYLINCKIYHAVSEKLEGPFVMEGVALEGTGNKADWDAWTIHSVSVTKIDGKYVLVYMGNSPSTELEKYKTADDLAARMKAVEVAGQYGNNNWEKIEGGFTREEAKEMSDVFKTLTNAKRVGMAISNSPYGPWKRVSNKPVIDVGSNGSWDEFAVANPSIIKTYEGKYFLYYKALVIKEDEFGEHEGNRKYGLAISENLEGPYVKYPDNPIIDFEPHGNNANLEDANVFKYEGKYYMVSRDMGWQDHQRGIIMESKDGIHWGEPVTAYKALKDYSDEKSIGIQREGRFERPQVYINEETGIPEALYGASTSGKFGTSSSNVFLINWNKLKGK